MKKTIFRFAFVVIFASLFTGCSLKYTINNPEVSGNPYDITTKKHFVMQVVDQRSDKNFHQAVSNLKNLKLELKNVEDPILWLSQALEREFTARGVSLEITSKEPTNPPDLILIVKKYQIVSRRVSGFSPWESFHSFMGELKTADQTTAIRAYFFDGKVPVWSMAEIQEPCFQTPMTILIKEIASKVNSNALHYAMSEEKVKAISNKIETQMKSGGKDLCYSLIELGATNNPEAMAPLLKIADTQDPFARGCAFSAIGILGGKNEFNFLKQKYEQYSGPDRPMALKAIGDIGTPESTQFVEKAKQDSQYSSEGGFKYCVDLYLEK